MKNFIGIIALGGSLCASSMFASDLQWQTETISAPENLGFEKNAEVGSAPDYWYAIKNGFTVTNDPTEQYNGYWSARISSTPESGEFGALAQCVNASEFGYHVHLRGYIKASNVSHGWAGFWMRVDSADGETLAFDNMQDRGVNGTKNWTRYEVTLPVATNAEKVCFGILLSGQGNAWFDELSIR
jgi:hypothetical protein